LDLLNHGPGEGLTGTVFTIDGHLPFRPSHQALTVPGELPGLASRTVNTKKRPGQATGRTSTAIKPLSPLRYLTVTCLPTAPASARELSFLAKTACLPPSSAWQ